MNSAGHYIGQVVEWETIGGEKYSGTVVDIDNLTLIIELPDGTTKAVSGWKWGELK